jgi:hypothetical protein
MTITGSIYFLGRYRPAYFEAPTISACNAQMFRAVEPIYAHDKALRDWLYWRIAEGSKAIDRDSCTAWSADHCDRGVSFAKRPHDPFLDDVTASLPPCPGLDYSGAVNSLATV